MTKNALFIGAILCFLSAPLLVAAYSSADALEAPPVAQALVREGDFAVRLADALKLGSPASEVEAMSALAAAGVAPQNGWIADYPITPDILGELEVTVEDAADAGRLTISRDEALTAFRGLAVEFDLAAVTAAPESGDLQGEPPKSYSLHSDPAVVHNHYYSAGPPVVTYYPPPPDYFYLYGWVPYPFYWHSFWFPGFYILHDFNRVVYVRHRTVKVVSNHVFVPRTRKFEIVDHRSRVRGRGFEDRSRVSERRRFDSPEARRGAASIVERSRSRDSFSGSSRTFENRRPSGSGAGTFRQESRQGDGAFTRSGPGAGASRDFRAESFNRSGTGQRFEGRRPDSSSTRSGSSLNRPSGTGSNRFNAITGNQGRSSQSFRGSSSGRSSTIQRAPSSRAGSSFQRPSRSGGGARSFSSPSMRSGSGGSRGGVRQEMRGAGGGVRGGSARSGSSAGGCRGRC
jgi:hypothetical protein